MGSGTTGVACINTNRNFVGIEKNEQYYNIAKNRIEDSKFKFNFVCE
jgi:site-specific DNA-methyltransferase (adenine-specific)